MIIFQNKKITILLFGVLTMLGAVILIKSYYDSKIPVTISINIDERIKDHVEIYINPYGYELVEYTPNKNIGFTNLVYPMFKNSEIQDDYFENISQYSHYIIYAKYEGKYALIRTTNTLVLGDSMTNIEFSVLLDHKNRPYITVVKNEPSYQPNPNKEITHYSYFYKKSEFNKIEPKSKKILNALKNIEKI